MVSKVYLLWLVFLFGGGGWCWSHCDGCWDHEKTALLQLKPFFDSHVDGVKNWGKGPDCCEWEKVECSNSTGRVVRLFLNTTITETYANGYLYTSSPNWGDQKEQQQYLNVSLFLPFEELQSLYLRGNSIAGFVGHQGELSLNKLEVLGLSYNQINSSIFSSLNSLSNLKSLDLSWNRLEGPIHIKELNALSGLEELYMGGNQVKDFVPLKDAERLMNLKVLDLSDNHFNKSILAILGKLTNLKSLYLGGNKFEGSIDFIELNALTHLEDLSICVTDNKTWSLPLQSLGLFPSLKTLFLRRVNIQGTIMTSQNGWHNFSNLEELFVTDSLLQTNFLESIGQFTSLKRLYLYDCEINGSPTLRVQRHIFSNLEELVVSNYFLQINFLGSIGQYSSLKRLDLTGYVFSENLISKEFCELPNLQELKLRHNYIEGVLPGCVSNLTSLQTLDLSGNDFSGDISSLKSLAYLQTLNLSSNKLSGNISALQSLTFLETLDLSDNQFSGNISALQSLTSLQTLILSNNNFQIPISLGPLFKLSKLKLIYADNNALYAETEMQYSLGAPAFQLKGMSLSCCGDVGSFPGFLYHQHDLRILDLSNIFFKGNQFPYWLLENNTKLESLYLTNTSLSGTIQLPVASHMGLSFLDISNNFFNESIPVETGEKLPSLSYLNMSNNHFIGRIPSSFGGMYSLDTLDLSNNQLSGGIPELLTMTCPSLEVLVLSNNKLEGRVFSENFNLTSLTELRLDGNYLSGEIPDVLSQSPSLSTLDVSKNRLSGGIPRLTGNVSHLEKLIMSNNHLQGTIPVEFCQLGNLVLLDLSVNNISGTLPSCFSSFWQITQINLSKNRLRGTLPNELRYSFALVTLDISDNLLSGSIPSWIGELSSLSYLLLSNNFFQGEIPMELCMLNQLSLINLSRNNLSGRIPPCLKITTLEDGPVPPNDTFADGSISMGPTPTYFTATSPQFSLNEPIDFPIKNVSNTYKGKIISLVSGIDLSCNKLVGEIPFEFGNFYKIIVLNLSHNSLTGPIPPTFANLKQIESLDLSYNNLSGSIPPQLVGLTFMAYFVVSFNNLSGMTPPRAAQFGTFDESSFRGNPFLCGEPLPKCGDTGPPNPSSDGDKDDGLIDMGVFHVSFVVSYMVLLLTVVAVLYINPYWRRVWFYHAETTATSCYYFVLDNVIPRRFRC